MNWDILQWPLFYGGAALLGIGIGAFLTRK